MSERNGGSVLCQKPFFHYDIFMQNDPYSEDRVTSVGSQKRKTWRLLIIAFIAAIFLFGGRLLAIYIDALWFSSVGYSEVYWYKFKLGGLLFLVFLVTTFLMLRVPFVFLDRAIPQLTERPRLKLVSVEDLREINFLPLIYRPGIWILSAVVALGFAISMAGHWSSFALYLNATSSGNLDPVFNRDVSFYLFTVPVLEILSGWFSTVVLIVLAVVAGASGYIWYLESVQGFGTAETRRRAASAISMAAAFLAIALAITTYLSRYDLLRSLHPIFTGASYTDVHVRLPGLTAVSIALVISFFVLLLNALVLKKPRVLAWTIGSVIVVWLIALAAIPQIFQSLSVRPNELAKEAPYIQNNIDMTRRAFGLDRFEELPFQPASTLSRDHVESYHETIANVRLWDPHVLQANISQNQAIRTYYRFNVPDVDRYIINGKLQQVLLAAREMKVDQLPDQSRNWINQHLVYTHGYGVTMSPVREFLPEGGPNLILRNMPVESDAPEIKVTRPEVYYGEYTNNHVYVHTKPQGSTLPEFNYPAPGSTDSYSQYEDDSGIPVGGLIRQTALAVYLGDGTNLLFSDYITSDSRLLMRRNVLERVRTIAPFLLFESDPYIVISAEGELFWIVDGFSYSDRYPYSSAYNMSGVPVNYVRNSVKALVNAYTGESLFYIFEPDDPIVKSYRGLFPSLFKPANEMPEDLLRHVRYPDLLAEIQARAYTLYHMLNAQTFYNREDVWAFANLDSGTEGVESTPMQPYYVLMALPEHKDLEFVSILPFTPAGQGRNNMIGWIAQRSDGERYGQTLVFSFPKNITVNGPAQIKARFNQDAYLSQQINLWNQQGSRVIRGNLQAIPVADSLLYIEPIYLQAVNSPLPELRQVAVATQDRIATGKTFEEALTSLFPGLPWLRDGLAEVGDPAVTQQDSAAQAAIQQDQQAAPPQRVPGPGESRSGPPTQPSEFDAVAQQAQQLLSDYQRLTAEGKHREAGDKLEQLTRLLAEYNRRRGAL